MLFRVRTVSGRVQSIPESALSESKTQCGSPEEGKYTHLALRDSQALLGQMRTRSVIRSKCFDLVADKLQVHA
jgi:hypothetical protein